MSFSFTSQTFGFADGGTGNANTGHDCVYGAGGPAAGDIDILCINSDTTVTTPTGFTATVTAVANQGAYIFTRKAAGGESATVRVKTNGDFDTNVVWVRLTGANTTDVTGSAQANGSAGTSSPAFTSGVLAAATEFGLAFAALHGGGVTPSNPVWGAGYTALAGSTQGTLGVAGYVGYKTPVGTAAESPTVSWTGSETDRYLLFVTFTTAATVVSGTLAASLGAVTGAITGRRTVHGTVSAVLGGLTARLVGTVVVANLGNSGSWYSLLDLRHEDAQFRQAYDLAPPAACPNDGEPLEAGPGGVLHCRFDGWVWDGFSRHY